MSDQEQNRPHILILITKGDHGGAQIHVLSLIKSLKHKYRFTLACGEDDFVTQEAIRLGIDVLLVDHLKRQISLPGDIRCYRSLRKILKEIHPDLLHAHSSKAGVIGRFAAFSENIPSLFTAHGWAFTEGVGALQRIYGFVAEYVMAHIGDGIISVSNYDYHLANGMGIRGKFSNDVIINCVEPVSTVKNYPPDGIFTLLNVGRMTNQKNQKLLIKALSIVDRDFQLNIVGAGVLKSDLERLASELGIADKVNFIEAQSDISKWYLEAHLFILSSIYEGLPLSVIEAMSVGVPVISTNVSGVSEAVVDGKTGFLVPRNDYSSLAEKITMVIDDRALLLKLSQNSIARYQEKFTLDIMCTKTSEVYERLIKH